MFSLRFIEKSRGKEKERDLHVEYNITLQNTW